MTTPATVTIDVTAPGVIIDNKRTTVLVQPGTYAVKSINHGNDRLVLINVPAVPNFYVGVHPDWLHNVADNPDSSS